MTNVESMTNEALLYSIKDCAEAMEAFFDSGNSERYTQEIMAMTTELATRIADDKAFQDYVAKEDRKSNSFQVWLLNTDQEFYNNSNTLAYICKKVVK